MAGVMVACPHYLHVELLSGSAESLENVESRVAAVHVLRVEVALHKLAGRFFNPGLDLVPRKIYISQM